MCQRLVLALCCIASFLSFGCVEHRGSIQTEIDPRAQIFKDGTLVDAQEAQFSSALPQEMHVDAWFRDEQGYIYRSHIHLLSPRPWWQRFPADLLTDALWPKKLTIQAEGHLLFQANEKLEPSYLDTLANNYGYAETPTKTANSTN